MDLYHQNLSLFDFAPSDHIIDSLTHASIMSLSAPEPSDYGPTPNRSPPKHRHDGTSPLPLGMDFSPPPREWDGRDSIWPHDPHTGWSYCVTIPSWIEPSDPDPLVLYRVQVGIQSPDGVTSTRAILRRFNEFLKLLSELKKAFPHKVPPPAPSKKHLRIKTKPLLEERRQSLEGWMEKLLSDIDISRSAPVAIFLELEAAARSWFDEMNQISNATSAFQFHPSSDASVIDAPSSSDYRYDSFSEKSEIGTPGSNQDLPVPLDDAFNADAPHGDEFEHFSGMRTSKPGGHMQRLSAESFAGDGSTVRLGEISTSGVANSIVHGSNDLLEGSEVPRMVDNFAKSGRGFLSDSVVALPSDEQQKMNRVLRTLEHRLGTAKTDMEDLIARLDQELAARQCLATKVKDLEVELETTIQNCKGNLQQAVLSEREKFTQMQWDMEALRTKCLELELKLKAEQEEKSQAESANVSIILENQALLQELDATKEQLVNLQKSHELMETKSKTDVKLLVKEVKSLRSSYSELKWELGRAMKEKIEAERFLEKEKKIRDGIDVANSKLVHECEILHKRLLECSVNFTIDDDEKLTVDASTPADAIDLLTTSDNRIGLLLAEAQLLAQDVESWVVQSGNTEAEEKLRKIVTDVFIDNATLRKQVNTVIRCSLDTPPSSENEEEEEVR